METISYIWPILTGSLIVPMVGYIKSKLPKDFPLQAPLMTMLINILIMAALFLILKIPMDWGEIVKLALAGQVASQLTHAGIKTSKKLPT